MKKFSIKVNEELSLKGIEYLVEEEKAHLLVFTGMDEYSLRYEYFANELNKDNISVSILDHFGQGENVTEPSQLQIVPKGSWDLEIKALYLKINEMKKKGIPVYLMGHSMGSFSVQSFILKHPHFVDGVIIMGTNGPNNKIAAELGSFLSNFCAHGKRWDKQSSLLEYLALSPFKNAIKNRNTDLDWLSYNTDNIHKYIKDDYCGAPNTNGFYFEMMHGLASLYKKKNLMNLSKDERILIVSGIDDPVGANSKGPKALSDMYKKYGINDVNIILYDHMRHEILNEDEKEKVVDDIKKFIK